ncbi:MAG: DUF1501 domain-containing protein, partial [Acidobacteria bacterium]|nr:DUF1501 domain-containing protein [Acidobacteriota bacterium]
MKENRREFLKKSCRALSMAAMATQMRHLGLVSVLARERMEEESVAVDDYKALVCVYLDGGNDGHNSIVPNYDAGYAQYAAVRQAQGLAISRNSLLPVTPDNMGGQVYGFHPSMSGMQTLFNNGKLALVCNVGCLVQPLTRATYLAGAPRPYQLFSHPDQAEQARTSISNFKSTTGWGGRVADRTSTLNPGGAIPMITSISGANIFTTGFNVKPLIVGAAPTPLNQVLTLDGFGTAADELARRTAMNNARQFEVNYTITQNASVITQQAVAVSQQLSTDPV